MPKNSTGVFYKYIKGNMLLFSFIKMYKFKDGCFYFLRISPCILHACVIKFILKCYAIVLHFLSFSLFFHFFSISSTRKIVPWEMSALDIHSIVLLIGSLPMSSSISLNKKELYEEHVQNSYSDRKGSNKVYQRSYKKTSYLQLSLERRYSKIQST